VDCFEDDSYKISLPPTYIEAALLSEQLHEEKVGSFLDLVKKQYEK